MRTTYKRYSCLIAGLLGIAAAAPASGQVTGAWIADDGATYYIRQVGNTVSWVGMSADHGRSFTNVFRGTLRDSTIAGSWADLPLGGSMQYGRLSVKIVNTDAGVQLWKESEAGGFGANLWRRGVYGYPAGDTGGPAPEYRGDGDPANLTGLWAADDGATYYVHQIGATVWWLGMSGDDGLSFTNVFQGTYREITHSVGDPANYGSVTGEWMDVPKGRAQSQGVLSFTVEFSGELIKRSQTGGFGGSRWRRLSGPQAFSPSSPEDRFAAAAGVPVP